VEIKLGAGWLRRENWRQAVATEPREQNGKLTAVTEPKKSWRQNQKPAAGNKNR
jgi:hypothetical protein